MVDGADKKAKNPTPGVVVNGGPTAIQDSQSDLIACLAFCVLRTPLAEGGRCPSLTHPRRGFANEEACSARLELRDGYAVNEERSVSNLSGATRHDDKTNQRNRGWIEALLGGAAWSKRRIRGYLARG